MVPAARPPNSPAATSPPPARTGVVAALVSVSAINAAARGKDRFICEPRAWSGCNGSAKFLNRSSGGCSFFRGGGIAVAELGVRQCSDLADRQFAVRLDKSQHAPSVATAEDAVHHH